MYFAVGGVQINEPHKENFAKRNYFMVPREIRRRVSKWVI